MSFSKKKYLDMKCEETGNKAEMCTQGTRKALQFQQTSKAEDLLWQDPNPKYIQTRLKKNSSYWSKMKERKEEVSTKRNMNTK